MKALSLSFRHAWLEILEHARQPMFLISTMLFPGMFFWFFGVPNADAVGPARLLTASFAVFAVLGVVFFQFAINIAQERGTSWSAQLRLLPAPLWVPMLGRLLANLIFSVLAIACVFIVAETSTPADLPMEKFLALTATLLVGAIPFGFAALLVGVLTSSRAVVPVANMIYLPLSFAGGLWLPPNALPKIVQDFSEYLPTRMLGEIAWGVLLDQPIPSSAFSGLSVYALVFAVAAIAAYRRDLSVTYG